MQDSLLIELQTEELPPKSLRRLSEVLGESLHAALKDADLLAAASACEVYATPRRLGVRVTAVAAVQPERSVERKGPAVSAGLDAEGRPTRALEGFAKSAGVPVDALARVRDGKHEYFVARTVRAGQPLAALLPDMLAAALKKLPIPKMMRWGDSEVQFVRPVHGLIALHGAEVLPFELLGQKAGRVTRGHRFLSQGPVSVPHADAYEATLEEAGAVIVSFARRKAMIRAQLEKMAVERGVRVYKDAWSAADFPDATPAAAARAAESLGDAALLDEVTALVEYPAVYEGAFDEVFLSVPIECLTLSMKLNQKYFPVAGTDGALLPRFAVVSNLKTDAPENIIGGNERVLRARLDDARFFFEQDKKARLESHVPGLASVVYHNKLGSQLERVERLRRLAGAIAGRLGADRAAAERAAYLAKADLLTGMVGEFPELQGIMGRYYAAHDGEPAVVADAVAGHYHPRFAGDALPQGAVAASVALADKLEILVGIYGIGQVPTGDKDPFGLRRHALGILRILVETPLALDLRVLLADAAAGFPAAPATLPDDLYGFMLDRLRSYLRDRGASVDEAEAILALQPTVLDTLTARLQAIQSFRRLPAAEALAAANKRIQNILKSDGAKGIELGDPAPAEAREDAEKALFEAVDGLAPRVEALAAAGRYEEALSALAEIRPQVDAFFDAVMVMADDMAVRRNRVRLLARLGGLMNRVADISRLAG